jgi:hypothetical protein
MARDTPVREISQETEEIEKTGDREFPTYVVPHPSTADHIEFNEE